jgi:hypothetical protein
MPTVLEGVGKKTIEHLDYVGNLNIQLWSTLQAMKSALPIGRPAFGPSDSQERLLTAERPPLHPVRIIGIAEWGPRLKSPLL